jgi:hypothetical protein
MRTFFFGEGVRGGKTKLSIQKPRFFDLSRPGNAGKNCFFGEGVRGGKTKLSIQKTAWGRKNPAFSTFPAPETREKTIFSGRGCAVEKQSCRYKKPAFSTFPARKRGKKLFFRRGGARWKNKVVDTKKTRLTKLHIMRLAFFVCVCNASGKRGVFDEITYNALGLFWHPRKPMERLRLFRRRNMVHQGPLDVKNVTGSLCRHSSKTIPRRRSCRTRPCRGPLASCPWGCTNYRFRTSTATRTGCTGPFSGDGTRP